MKHLAFLALLLALFLPNFAQATSADDLAAANKLYAEKSYQLAEGEFAKFLDDKSDKALAREVTFKWSDSALKAKDENSKDAAQKNLQELIDGKDHDRWWAEASVSLAMQYAEVDPYGHAADVKKWLDDARDYWAGSSDVDLAREKFISISFQLADFITTRWGWYNADIRPIRLGEKSIAPLTPPQGNTSLQVLYEEILKVAKADADKSRAHYGLAMAYMQNYSGDEKLQKKAVDEFHTVMDDFENSDWADDAAYQLGVFFENHSDFVKAADAYSQLIKKYKAGETPWLDESKRRLESIVNPALNISVGNNFVPGSEIQLSMSWRNIKGAKLAFYKIDLAKELVAKTDKSSGYYNYQEAMRAAVESGRYKSFPKALETDITLAEEGKHISHSEYKGLAEWRKAADSDAADPKAGQLEAGAYIMVATADGVTAPSYDLVLVSDLALVSKVAKNSALLFAIDAKTGKPVAKTPLRLAYSYYDETNSTVWEYIDGVTDDDGLFKTPLKSSSKQEYQQQHQIFGVAGTGERQAFVQNNYYPNYQNNKGAWWLYAFSDRPAYRPGETISFKGLLRQPQDGSFNAPANMPVKALIFNAQGTQVKEGKYTTNDYGAFDDTMVLEDKAVLGEYRMELYSGDGSTHYASAQLFRLEEYKLPEFIVKVAAKPKEDKSGINAYRLGDTVTVDIDAKYYFGGPVANADVEYLVYASPLYRTYRPWRQYSWYYDDMYQQNNGYYGGGGLLKTEKIKTDDKGQAHFTIDTPKDGADMQYRVEARVVDKSRREIRATSEIKVTKTAFFAYLEAKQNLYRPGDKAQVTAKTMTADETPVAVEGKVRVMRNWWRDPVIQDGKTVNPGGYDGTEVLTKFVKTNDKGEAVFEFEPAEDGYYAVEFTGFDNGNEVTGAANVFVSKSSSTNIGYRYGGLQIITEKDTYAPGETLRAMVVSDQPGTDVLLSAESDNIYDARVLHMDGSVKMVEMPVDGKYIPNIFLSAVSGDHYQLKSANIQLIVPPAEKFLNVKVTSDKATYQPQEQGNFDIEVTDKDGKPVSAEVAIGLTDAAVYYIQDEYAPDIRQFFYGDKKLISVQTQASFYQRPYVKLVRNDKGALMTDDEAENEKRRDRGDMPKGAPQELGQLGGGMRAMDELKSGMAYNTTAANGMAAPAAPAMMAAREEAMPAKKTLMKDKSEMDSKADAGKENAGGAPAADERVRNDFRSTVIWLPSVKTDANGKASVKAVFPDSLTTWRLTARADTPETAIGNVTHEVTSSKSLQVRLQAPRFFTERDLTDVSAIIDNMTDAAITVTPQLKAEGLVISGLYRNGEFVKGQQGPIEVPAHGQARTDWAVSAAHAGTAKLTVRAAAGNAADAMEKTYPVIPHGIEKFLAQSLAMKDGGEQVLHISIPKERIKESTSLRLSLSPSMAANLLDALPYLADYPYGCVEQTMSRFLPAVIVGKTMRELGIADKDVDAYISDVLEARGDPAGHPQRRSDTTLPRLKTMTDDGLKRLYDFQHADGGWGWWKTGDSDRFMTSYVVWGLSLAKSAGVEVKDDVISRAVSFLQTQLVQEENNPDNLAWMLHALSYSGVGSQFQEKQRARLWDMRDKLNPYTRALFALAENRSGDKEHARILSQNIINGIKEDKDNATAHWGEAGVNYRWSDGGVEATAFNISALAQMDAGSKYLEPAVKWMSLNRRGASWKNTRDTAIAILGLTDYLKATHELTPDYSYTVTVNGKVVREGTVDRSNVFSFNRLIDLPAEALKDGDNEVKVSMKGTGALYMAAYAKFFTLEEPITKAGNEVFVTRKYFRQSTKETLLKGYNQDWAELKEGDALKSGDRVRVDVTVDAKNNYEYLLAEDYKPAGLEAVELNSGEGEAIGLDKDGRETDSRTPLYEEFRDQKAAFFIGHLKQGKHLLRYELRAEIPGEFHAMPDQLHAMYVPEIRSNSDEARFKVTD